MRITNLAISKHITVFALMVVVIVVGVSSYLRLPREANPELKIPFVMVYAPYYGSSPQDMENLVTRKLETQLKALPDLEEMTSSSSEGVSTIVLEFSPDVDMTGVLQKVRDGVELAKPDLPQDVRDDLLVYELSSDDWPIMKVVVSADYDPVQLKEVAEDIQEELETIRGVIAVDLTGGVEREVRVDIDPERLRFYGLSLVDVQDAIAFENTTIPGGELALGTYEYQVRVPGEFESIDEVLNVIVNAGSVDPVYLRDIADVRFGLKDRSTVSRLNRIESVTLSVKKRSGSNLIEIADEVNATMARLTDAVPPGTEFAVIADQSVYVRDMVSELENNILSGMLLVVGVLFLFLGLTNSFFVGVAIPFSMLIAFIVLRALGLTLNMVTLFSLILALGMLVDNAIVIVENIFRHRTEGHGAIAAAEKGTAQVSSAVIASTLTTVFAFGPLILWPGIMGQFMKYLPITLVVTLLSSLLVALVFNPVLCAVLMRVPTSKGGKPRFGDRLMARGLRSYEPVLRWALGHRALTIFAMFLGLVGVMMAFGRFNAGVELFPDVDPTYAYVSVEAPSGTRVEQSDAYTQAIEIEVDKLEDMKSFVTEVGATGGNAETGSESAPPHLSLLSLEFEKYDERRVSSRDELEKLRASLGSFTGAEVFIKKQEAGPPAGETVNIEISGENFDELGRWAEVVKDRIRDVPGLVNLQDTFDRGRPEIRVRVNPEKAARYGLRRSDIASTVRTALQGNDISKYRIGEDEYDIMVRYAPTSRQSVEDLEDLTVFYEGESVPLTSFADVSYTTGLGSIQRIDGRRVVSVTAGAAAGFNGNAILGQAQSRLTDLELPKGYAISYTGESEEQEEAQQFLSDAFGIALMLIFVVLITQFTSVTVPFVILSSVILSLIGVFVGLLINRMPFGIIMTGVGVISLAGIVVNNAIVLLDYVLKLRAQGLEPIEAIVQAGRTRFRPVVLTAITTVLGLIPLTTGLSINFNRLFAGDFGRALSIGGESSQWWGQMGVAVIWGLVVATFLTLVIVPVLYASIDPIKRFFYRVFVGWWRDRRRSTVAAGPSEA